MATVTVTGGPFTDGQGNVLNGDFQFQPQANVGILADDLPTEIHGSLGGWPNLPQAPSAFQPGCFSVVLLEGTYYFRLRMQTQVIADIITVDASNGASQTIESMLS